MPTTPANSTVALQRRLFRDRVSVNSIDPNGLIDDTENAPLPAVITPPVTKRRSTYDATKIGVIQPKPAWMASGIPGVYWGSMCKAPCAAFPDRIFNYFSTDHDASAGGIGVTVCVGDPTILTNWKIYDDALTAGWLVDIPNPPAPNGPIFTGFGGGNFQYETPFVNYVNGEFLMTYQATNVPGARNQATLIASSPNGISNWTGTHTPLMQVASSEVIGDGHHGYFSWGVNPFPRNVVPFDYVGYSLVGGQTRSTLAMWGSNAPKTAWTFISAIGKWGGRATPSARNGTNTNRHKWSCFRIDVNAIVQTRQGYAALVQFAGAGAGAAARPGDVYEILLAEDGKTIIGAPQLVIGRGTTGTFDNGEIAMGSVLRYADKSVICYNAANGSNVKTDAIAVSLTRNPADTWFNRLTPAIPTPNKITIKEFNFKGASALPAGLSVVTEGTALPVPSFSANGMDVTVNGSLAQKSEIQFFEDEGFDPLTTEYIDVIIDDWTTTTGVCYRLPYIGFATTKSVRASMVDAIFIGTGDAATGDLRYSLVANGAQPIAAGTSEDYWSVGYGTSIGTSAQSKKSVGVRIFPKDNYACILVDGTVEMQEFRIGTTDMMPNFDKSKRWYPFFGFRGQEIAATTERVGKMTVRVSAPARAVGDATVGTIGENRTGANIANMSLPITIGAAAPDRVVAFYVCGSGTAPGTYTATFTPTSGTAINLTLASLNNTTFGGVMFMMLFVANIPTGVDGTINVIATGVVPTRWGVQAIPLYGVAQAMPNDVDSAGISGNGGTIKLGIQKFDGGVTAAALVHSTSGATFHNNAAEENRFAVDSQEVVFISESGAQTNFIGIRNKPASSVQIENTASGGNIAMVASWNRG
jgi:hypothetical protein